MTSMALQVKLRKINITLENSAVIPKQCVLSSSSMQHDFMAYDAEGSRLTPSINGQGLPCQNGLARLRRQVERTRIGTLNVSAMNRKNLEMKNKRVGILCVQETRWKDDKTKDIWEGYKLLYSGADVRGRNGVGVILSRVMKDNESKDEKLVIGGEINDHIGTEKRIHEGWGMEGINEEGKSIIDFEVAYDLATVSTFFKKHRYET
ncbi:uncharacterized protein LOC119595273 [Penaeus monodon]|uniref:uncharacterized protein LOC119595273 n=1 Tax=Penaeus monodon TaxID=6687 RepID=UPI0018A7A8F5|nr:uncharacterized protein LOC119595273 [Penaeus monodon]